LDYWVLGGTLFYVLAYAIVCLLWQRRRHWRKLVVAVFGGACLTLGLMLLLGIGTLLGFDRLFYNFHLLFFSNEFWYAQGYMLKLFTEEFFYDAALFCALGCGVVALILGGLSGWWLLATRRRTTA
jgi:uncharacterized membrane protein